MRVTKHEAKMRWLWENKAFLEENYAGKYIAVDDCGLVGSGDSDVEALKQAKEAGHPDPLITGVRKRAYQGVPFIASSRILRA